MFVDGMKSKGPLFWNWLWNTGPVRRTPATGGMRACMFFGYVCPFDWASGLAAGGLAERVGGATLGSIGPGLREVPERLFPGASARGGSSSRRTASIFSVFTRRVCDAGAEVPFILLPLRRTRAGGSTRSAAAFMFALRLRVFVFAGTELDADSAV